MEYALIGEHLPHSFSQIIHTKLGRYDYILNEVAPEELDDFMTKRQFKGLNVTIPYKQAVIPYLHEISDRAQKIGAVNTIVNKNGQLFGDNTDFGGMVALIKHLNLDISSKKVLILGTGGTSKTAYAVATSLNASTVLKVSRSANDGAISYEEAYKDHSDAQIIINTTPNGMFPNIYSSPIEIDRFKNLEGVIDAIYNPLRSKLVSDALKLGLKAEGGLYMLVAQAVLAGEIFTNQAFPENTIEKIYQEIKRQKENIVLIGMPSSGKSTISKLLSQKLNVTAIDTDTVIFEKANMPIPEIFTTFGEKHFRDLESEAVQEVSKNGGIIIATGGGAVLRSENVEHLKMNGIIVFLDSPLEQLAATNDRPLSNSYDKLKALYDTRYPIYKAASDLTISVSTDPDITLSRLLQALNIQ